MEDTSLVDDKINLAILYFKSQNYEKALSTYNVLINQLKNLPRSTIKQIRKSYNLLETPLVGPAIHPKLGSLLDQRAATYEKLNQLASALKDGRELIKLEPIGCKGYLRTGKILYSLDKKWRHTNVIKKDYTLSRKASRIIILLYRKNYLRR